MTWQRAVWLVPLFFAVLLKEAVTQGRVRVEVTPTYPVVAREGETVSVQCRAGREMQYCRIEQVLSPQVAAASNRRTAWNLSPGVPEADGISYAGDGLQVGQCGFTVRRLQRSFNGAYRCTMGFSGTADEGVGNFNITVAVAPSPPELSVISQRQQDQQSGSRPSSSYPDDQYSRYPSSSNYPGNYPGSVSSNYPGGASSNYPGSSGSGNFQEGEGLTAMCTVRNGRPAANLTWFMDEQEIHRGLDSPRITYQADDLITIQQNLSLQVSWRDHGKALRCVAGHIALGDRNNQTTYPITVKFKPRPHSNPIDQFGFVVGATGEIPVEVNANPKPTITWRIDNEEIQENSQHSSGRFVAPSLINNGSGSWTAVLRIAEVTMQDIEREYTLVARNELGEETYRIRLSTSSEPQVMSLEAGAIIGIVVAILVLLLAIFLLVFARTTGRWCFAGGVSKQDPKESVKFLPEEGKSSAMDKVQNDENAPLAASTVANESSDTESADHGPTHNSKKPKAKFSYMFKKKGDKVGDDTAAAKEVESPVSQRPVQQQSQQQQQQPAQQRAPDSIVYAELDLKDLGDRRPQVRPDEERTEYAEILYTAKPAGGPEHTSPPQP